MILLILSCLLLTTVIAIQNPKGSNLAIQFVKAKESKTLLTKATWGLGLGVALITLVMM